MDAGSGRYQVNAIFIELRLWFCGWKGWDVTLRWYQRAVADNKLNQYLIII